MTAAQSRGGADERWYLNDEAEFLRRSLDDADREHLAGDLSDEDYAALLARDRPRLDEVEAALSRLGPAAHPADDIDATSDAVASPKRSAWRQVGIIGCCVLIVVGVVILVVHATQARQPGQASSGSIAQSQAVLIEEQLGEAQTFMQQNQTLKALELYDKVLAEDPRDPNALANAGWLEWKSAFGQPGTAKVLADGRKKIETSIRLAPSDYEGHKYLGVILTQYGDATGAQKQFAQFLADDPPAGEIEAEASLITGVYQKVGVPLPSALRSTTTTTSRP